MRTFAIFALVIAAVVALAQGKRLNSPPKSWKPQMYYSAVDERLGSIQCDACKDVLGFLESRILAKGCDVGTNILCDGITDFLAPVCDFIVDHACSFVSDELRKHIPNSDICDHIHLC